MLFRIKREIFKAGEFEQHIFNEKVTKADLCEMYHLDPATTAFYNNKGEEITCDMDVLLNEPFVVAMQHPGELGTVVAVSAIVLAAALVTGTALYAIGVNYWDWKDIFGWWSHEKPQATYAYSLRGSANPRRKGGRIGLLLGRACITADQAGLIYSSYNPNNLSQGGSGKQWLHQLFCYGYKDVVVMKDSSFVSTGNPQGYMVRIGESPIDIFGDNIAVEINNDNPLSPVDVTDFSYYNHRCVEEGLTIRLDGAESDSGEGDASARYAAGVSRTSPTNTDTVRVGVCAPYGWYNQNNNDVIDLRMHYGIDIKAHSSTTWPSEHWVNHDTSEKYNGIHYRAMHTVNPSQWLTSHGYADDSNKQYDVRVYRYGWDDPSNVVKQDTLMVEFMQFDTRNPVNNPSLTEDDRITPVRESDRVGLLGLYAEATDKLNGYINQLNIECFLNTYYFTGNAPSNDPSLWRKDADPSMVGDRNNPACALLYMLISNDANPRSLNIGSDTHGSGASTYYTLSSNATTYSDINKIDWYALSDWFLFCKSMVDPNVSGDDGWKCNAWVTEELTVGELCSRICLTGRALFKVMDGKFSVLIQRETDNVTQMFTPRNAWEMQEVRSFEKPVSLGKASFIDMDTAEEVERYVLIDSDNVISYPDDISEVAPSLTDAAETYELWGVTKPYQVAQLMAFQLLCKRLQTRTYTWKCALESITCAVGDVIYLANDMFLFSLGYGRITEVLKSGNNITGVKVDEAMGIDPNKSYGITVRKGDGTITLPLEVNQSTSESYKLMFTTPVSVSTHDLLEGNLFIYGDQSAVGKKVIITGITPDQDKGATITAVDYVPEIYSIVEDTEIPEYTSGISVYGSGANISKGVVPPAGYQQGPTGREGERGSIWSNGTAIRGTGTSLFRGFAGNVGDYYLNTDTNDLYRCITAGTEVTAVWRWVGNIEGDPGDISSNQYEVEYALSLYPDHYSWAFADFGYSADDAFGFSDSEGDTYGFYDIVEWGSDYSSWYKGLYVWQRIRITAADGEVSYSDPAYCKAITESLINGCTLEIMLTDSDGNGDTQTWEKNVAVVPVGTTPMVTIEFRVLSKCYSGASHFLSSLNAGAGITVQPYKAQSKVGSATVIVPTVENIQQDGVRIIALCSHTFPKSADYDSLVIDVGIKDSYIDEDTSLTYDIEQKASASLDAVDVTATDVFGGLIPTTKNAVSTLDAVDALANAHFTSEKGGVADGSTFAVNCDNIDGVAWLALRTYVMGTGWKWLNAADSGFDNARVSGICSQAQKTVLSMIPAGSVTQSDFAYFNTLIVGIITADYIGAKEITLQSGGVIQSSGITAADVGSDGHLTKDGFRLEDTGTMRAKKGYFKDIKVIDADVTGNFTSSGFATQDASSTHTLSASISSPNRWNIMDFHIAVVRLLNQYHTSTQNSRPFWYNTTSGTIYTQLSNYSWASYSFSRVGAYTVFDSTYDEHSESVPFGSGAGQFSSVYFVYRSSNTALVYVDSYYTGDQSTAAKQLCASIYGELSNFQNYTAIALAYPPGMPAISSGYTANVVYGGSTRWASSSNLSVYWYDLSTIALDTTNKAFTGTITINGTVVVNATSSNVYYIRKDSDSTRITISDSTQTAVQYIYTEMSKSWAISISVAAGVTGIQAMNVMPMDTSTSKVGTQSLPFKESHITRMYGNVNSDPTNYKVWGAVFN